jgi:hypothetical protein
VNFSNANSIWQKLYGPLLERGDRKHLKFQKGDSVRISKAKNIFEKSYLPSWTDEVFNVDEAVEGNPVSYYRLKDYENEPVMGRLYEPELGQVRIDKGSSWRIEEVLKRKIGKEGEEMLLVKFLGYQKPEWIRSSQIIN